MNKWDQANHTLITFVNSMGAERDKLAKNYRETGYI